MSETPLTVHSQKLLSALSAREGSLPVWIRASPRGPERYTGLSRAKLYQLANAGAIRTAVLKEPGGVKGVRLFHLGSILAFIEKHSVEQEAA